MTSAQVARKVREPVVEKVNKALLNARQKHGAVANVAATTGQTPLWIAVANVSVPRDGRTARIWVQQGERKSPERPLPPMAPCLLAEVWR